MSIVRVGSTTTYAAGWDAVFGNAKVSRSGKAGRKKARTAAGRVAKRKTVAAPRATKAAKKARTQQSARTKKR